MGNDSTTVPGPHDDDTDLDVTEDGGASTDGKGGYVGGQGIPGGGTTTGSGTGSSA